ncbi:MAG: endonuclease V [Bacteroidota bacterium]
MKIAIDVHYRSETTKTVAVLFDDWVDSEAKQFLVKYTGKADDYVPGEFYRRELPCLLNVLKEVDVETIDCIIIDGFVYLGDQQEPGLGAYLFQKLEEKIPVIGVAKSNFLKNKKSSVELLRGDSTKPLYVTADGISLDEAAQNIAKMEGKFRMPTLLQQLDTKTKEP